MFDLKIPESSRERSGVVRRDELDRLTGLIESAGLGEKVEIAVG
jgi:hypothetical protein